MRILEILPQVVLLKRWTRQYALTTLGASSIAEVTNASRIDTLGRQLIMDNIASSDIQIVAPKVSHYTTENPSPYRPENTTDSTSVANK